MESMFVGLLTNDVSLSDILVGLHNACSHGTHIDGTLGDDDEYLGELMDNLGASLATARKMENGD